MLLQRGGGDIPVLVLTERPLVDNAVVVGRGVEGGLRSESELCLHETSPVRATGEAEKAEKGEVGGKTLTVMNGSVTSQPPRLTPLILYDPYGHPTLTPRSSIGAAALPGKKKEDSASKVERVMIIVGEGSGREVSGVVS